MWDFWKHFDREEICADFALIRSLGMTIVRVFLLWEDFQPNIDSVSEDSLGKLVSLCDFAQRNSLLLDITFFTGHMSGPNWVPPWMLTNEPRRMPAFQVYNAIMDTLHRCRCSVGIIPQLVTLVLLTSITEISLLMKPFSSHRSFC